MESFTNERIGQKVRKALPPAGSCRSDQEIIQAVAERLGAGWSYAGETDVMQEIAQTRPGYAAVSTAALAQSQPLWVCPTAQAETDARPPAPVPLPSYAYVEAPTEAPRPYILLTGTVREHHGTGVRSRRSEGLSSLRPVAEVQMNPADAATLGLSDGDQVRVSTAADRIIELPLKRHRPYARGRGVRAGLLAGAGGHASSGTTPHRPGPRDGGTGGRVGNRRPIRACGPAEPQARMGVRGRHSPATCRLPPRPEPLDRVDDRATRSSPPQSGRRPGRGRGDATREYNFRAGIKIRSALAINKDLLENFAPAAPSR